MKQNSKNPIRVLDKWRLYKASDNGFLVKTPKETIEHFYTKALAETYLITEFFNQFKRPTNNKGGKSISKKKQAFQKDLESMNHDRLMEMSLLESNKKVRLLFDYKYTRLYVVFDGSTNQSYKAQKLLDAEWFYRKLLRAS